MEMEELKNKYSFSDGLMEKIKHSIEVLRKGEEFALRFYDKGYYLAFSGGKDSQALYHITKLAGVKFEAHMNMTTVDPANVVSFVKNNYPDVIRHIPDINFYQLIRKKKCLPSRTQRYCCEVLKERGGGGTVTLVGIRAEESRTRSKRNEIGTSKRKYDISFDQFDEHKEKMVSCVGGKDKVLISPILAWTDKDVWEFLNKMNIKHCDLYDKGMKRIGCILCPMSNIGEMMKYPFNYPHQTKKFLNKIEILVKNGHYRELGKNPNIVLAWYLSKRTVDDFKGLVGKIQSGKFRPNKKNKELWDKFIDYFDLKNVSIWER